MFVDQPDESLVHVQRVGRDTERGAGHSPYGAPNTVAAGSAGAVLSHVAVLIRAVSVSPFRPGTDVRKLAGSVDCLAHSVRVFFKASL